MSINIKQSNRFGKNDANFHNSGNEITNKFIWKNRAEGFISGILVSVIASYIYSFLTI